VFKDVDLIYWLRLGKSIGCCEYGDELSGSIKCRVFLISLLLKVDYATCSYFVNYLVK
jgi:hypothetical protein